MKLTKKEQLLSFIRSNGMVKTSDVDAWGYSNKYTTAMRTARQLAQEGFIRRATSEEQIESFPFTKRERVWVFVKDIIL